MPTVLRDGSYRFFFYSNEGDPREAPHIHVAAGGHTAKFWLDAVELASNKGFRASEIKEMRHLVERHRRLFMEAWDAHFNA